MSNAEPKSSQDQDGPALALEDVPDPVVIYAVRDGEPVIERANGAYTATFGGVVRGRLVRSCWDARGMTPTDITMEELCSALAAGETLRTEVAHVPDEPDTEGHGEVYHFDPDGNAG